MTREQIIAMFTDLGLEAPSKGLVDKFLDAHNAEKKSAVDEAKKTAIDETTKKFEGFVSPDEHSKVVDELTGLKDKSARDGRIAKYKAKGFNVDDEDIANLLDSKFKDTDEKEFDKSLEEYGKSHPSFMKAVEKTEKKSTFFQGLETNKGKEQENEAAKMNNAIRGSIGVTE